MHLSAMEPAGPITDLFRTINYIEAGVWTLTGIGFAFRAARTADRSARRQCLIAAATLLAFGASQNYTRSQWPTLTIWSPSQTSRLLATSFRTDSGELP